MEQSCQLRHHFEGKEPIGGSHDTDRRGTHRTWVASKGRKMSVLLRLLHFVLAN